MRERLTMALWVYPTTLKLTMAYTPLKVVYRIVATHLICYTQIYEHHT